jgi:hypothetical protein
MSKETYLDVMQYFQPKFKEVKEGEKQVKQVQELEDDFYKSRYSVLRKFDEDVYYLGQYLNIKDVYSKMSKQREEQNKFRNFCKFEPTDLQTVLQARRDHDEWIHLNVIGIVFGYLAWRANRTMSRRNIEVALTIANTLKPDTLKLRTSTYKEFQNQTFRQVCMMLEPDLIRYTYLWEFINSQNKEPDESKEIEQLQEEQSNESMEE